MGSGFFGKIASIDPVAQALHLPGYNSYAKQQANAHLPGSNGPYTGVTPTLAGANAGYAPGGPGADPMWRQPQPWHQGGFLGALQGLASSANPGAAPGNLSNPGSLMSSPSRTGPVGQVNPYSAAAQQTQRGTGGNVYGV
jgi:hypothetical protein